MATEDEMAGWHHGCSGHEFEQLWEMVKDREVSGGQRSLCAAVHGVRESNTA